LPSTLTDELQQATLRVMVVLVLSQVLCEAIDPFSEQGYLDFSRPGIALASGMLLNDCGLAFLGQHLASADATWGCGMLVRLAGSLARNQLSWQT
jgi:hypothetical protein